MEDSRGSVGKGRTKETVTEPEHIGKVVSRVMDKIARDNNIHPTFKRGLRFKQADAIADGYMVNCPYKVCGTQFALHERGGSLNKGDVVTCPNCRKGIRIRRIR
jgi:hypothetical protein